MAYQKEVIEHLQSKLGITLRTQCSIQVEGAFGIIKETMNLEDLSTEDFKMSSLSSISSPLATI
jgi:hypothetical protein